MKLYWVTTPDHDEDWFIVASSLEEAAKYHENLEGYDDGEAEAEEIMDIPKHISAKVGWPPEELLLSLGATFLNGEDKPRVVKIGGRTFCEGLLESFINELTDDIFEKKNGDRPNKTKKSSIQ